MKKTVEMFNRFIDRTLFKYLTICLSVLFVIGVVYYAVAYVIVYFFK